MKTQMLCLALVFCCAVAYAQDLADVYRGGSVQLETDNSFASGEDWSRLFGDYNNIAYGKPVGSYKSIAIAEDGTVFLSNYSQYNLCKFDRNGAYLLTFGRKGNELGEFRNRPTLHAVLDNKYVFTSEHNGRLNFYTLDGDFYKLIQLDYMPLDCVALRDGKIAVSGHVPYGGGDVRNIVAIKDIESGEEKIVSSRFVEYKDSKTLRFKTETSLMSISNPFSDVQTFIRRSLDGNLIVGVSDSREISVFNSAGRKIDSFTLDVNPVIITEQDRNEYYEAARQSLEKADLPLDSLKAIKAPGFFPGHLPFFYNMLVDGDGNILAFEYTEDEKVGNRFSVYSFSPLGEFISRTTLDSEEYELTLEPRHRRLRFHEGYLYGLLQPKGDGVSPLQLVRMKLVNR